MIGWFRSKLAGFAGRLEELGTAVADAFRVLWTVITGLGTNVLRAWQRLYNAVRAVTLAAGVLGLEIYRSMLWAARVLVPLGLARAVDAVKRWAARLIHAVDAAWRLAVDAVKRWAALLMHAVDAAWRLAVDAVLRRLAAAASLLARVAPPVLALLMHPDRLAAWAFNALWALAWRTVDRLAEPILRWLLLHLLWLVQRELPVLERVIARMF